MSWSIGFSALTREQLDHAAKTMDFEQAYDYFNQLEGASFGSIPEIILEFANYNDALQALMDEGEPVDNDYLKLEFPRMYDEAAVERVLQEFNKLNFDDMDTFDDYKDIKEVCVDLRDLFQYAHDNQQIIILYRLI